MLQGSKLERNVPDDGTSLLQVCHRGSRNSHQHADTRMTGSRARWTVVLVLVIGVSFVGTVSGIDVYPNNEGRCCTIVTLLCCFRREMLKNMC